MYFDAVVAYVYSNIFGLFFKVRLLQHFLIIAVFPTLFKQHNI